MPSCTDWQRHFRSLGVDAYSGLYLLSGGLGPDIRFCDMETTGPEGVAGWLLVLTAATR